MVTFCVSGIIVWWSFGVVALLQIVAISLVDNPRVDIYILYRVAIMYGYKKKSGKPAAPPAPHIKIRRWIEIDR